MPYLRHVPTVYPQYPQTLNYTASQSFSRYLERHNVQLGYISTSSPLNSNRMEGEVGKVITKENDRSTPTNLAKQDSGVLIIGDGLESGKSLQDSFLKFRSQKIKERQIMKMCQQVGASGSRSEAFKDALRTKFIDAAKRYLGVPYALRFKAEGDDVAPLYLDCCALVRQAVQDLQEDFGFVIGRWNQAYQMDTLPVVLKFEELRPGDLIFYEGIYNSNRSKPQKHNNVHVEIFLGGETGEETIGSRYHRGKVSIFPSYKFKSTTWDLVQYHFRSLDTWLDGNCRSCCPEHPWHNDALNYLEAAGKRSIFSTDHEDESAGGEEEDAPQLEGDVSAAAPNEGSSSSNAAAAGSAVIESDEIVVNGGEEDETHEDVNSDDDEDIVIPVPVEVLTSDVTSSPSVTAAPELPTSNVLDAICPLDNLPKPVQSGGGQSIKDPSKPRRKSATEVAALIEETAASAKAGTKPKRSSSINRSTDNGTTAASSSGVHEKAEPSSLSVKKANVVSKSLDLSSKSTKVTSKDIPKVYYVGKSNGWKLVKAAMDKRGWQQLPFEYQFSSRYGLKWVERRSDIDYRNHVPGQLVCHIPNNDCITTKIGILTVLRDKFCKSSNSASSAAAVKIHPPWVPETYDLDIPADVSALMQAATDLHNRNVASATAEGAAAALDPEKITSGIWIYKPSCYNRGRGIRVVTGLDALKEICYGKQTGDAETSLAPLKGIVQKYIENPLLINPGYKFDIRCYMLIARNYPTTLAFYHPGYCRLALKTYDISSVSSLADTSVHLTNASVQKKDPIYEQNKELQIQSVLAVADTIEKGGAPSSAEYLRNQLDHDIKLCMVDVLKASNHKFIKKHGYFDLLGCDFMLSSDNKLHLLEINTNPALSLDNSTLENLLPGVVDGALELVLGSQGPDVKGTSKDAALLANIPQKFQLIFNEEKDYYYK